MPKQLSKCPIGIRGLDEITGGGLPQGRPTLICGSAGCGKTLFGIEFLVRGALQYGEPGVFMPFEETAEELTQNVTSFGWDLEQLVTEKKLLIDHVYIDPHEIQETGEYDLEALFIRLGYAINQIGAKRVVLDTIEVLFAGLSNPYIVRAELRRLFRWLKSQGITTIITGERGENSLTRQGLEEYVSDCVIRLDQRTSEEMTTRRLQIIKYRGSAHGVDEYPFLIEEEGISVLPVTSIGLDHPVSTERISSGLPRLDTMLGGQGYYQGSSILITGMAGTGKSTLAAYFAQATCQRGENCLYLATEEAPQQILRNMLSIKLNLQPYIDQGLLRFEAVRPTAYGLEMRLLKIHNWLKEFHPTSVIIDPMSNLNMSGNLLQTKHFFMRLIDFLKSQQITVFLTNLTPGGSPLEHTDVGVSSLMDTWLELRTIESNGERNRLLYILKSRGIEHSNQVREFLVTHDGVKILDVYLGQGKVLTGSARIAQQLEEQSQTLKRQQEFERQKREFHSQKTLLQAQIAALQVQLTNQEENLAFIMSQEEGHQQALLESQSMMLKLRKGDQTKSSERQETNL